MGRDKGLVPFLGKPLVSRVVERVAPLADELILTTNNPEGYRFLGLPLFSDIIPQRGSLSGLYTALSAASHPRVIVVACDMPFVNRRLLELQRKLLDEEQTDAVIPQHGDGMEPFHAIYQRETCLPLIQTALQHGMWRADGWFGLARITLLAKEKILELDPDLLSFLNVNTPEEVYVAEELARKLGDT